MRAISLFCLVIILLTFAISRGAVFEWPQYRGPERDNVSRETGLIKQWPSGGPMLLWTAEGIGEGYSTVAVANGLIYTTGNISKDTVIPLLMRAEFTMRMLMETSYVLRRVPVRRYGL